MGEPPTVIDYDTAIKSQFLMQGDMIERKGRFLTVLLPPVRDDWNCTVSLSVRDEDTNTRYQITIPFNVWVPKGTEVPAFY